MSETISSEDSQAKSPKENYEIQTTQEADALLRAIADGKTGRYWATLFEAYARVHQTPGASHHIRLTLPAIDCARPLSDLEIVTSRNDADFDYAMLYISKRLTPEHILPTNTAARAFIKLDEVIENIGWYPQNTEQRIAMRRRIWQFMKFAASIRIVGERNYKQRGKNGEIIETFIDSPPWSLQETEREADDSPAQFSLFDDDTVPPPVGVGIVASPMWARLTMQPDTAQFIAHGELLGAIPSGKAAGAWARCIGLALANLWRRNPREAISGKIRPTRRELLERYSIAIAPPQELLASERPHRAIQYWVAALEVLVECGFLAKEGEAALTFEEMRSNFPRKNWANNWLKGQVDLMPGSEMQDSIKQRSQALPSRNPKNGEK